MDVPALQCEHEEQPFFAFATSAPTYPGAVFDVGLESPLGRHMFQGSAILLSGGAYRFGHLSRSDVPSVAMAGLIGSTDDRRDMLFAGRAVACLVDLKSRVTIVSPRSGDSLSAWAETAKAVGFNVSTKQNAVVCVGDGHLLATVDWFAESCAWCLCASQGADSLLRRMIMSSSEVLGALRGIWDAGNNDPQFLADTLVGTDLLAGVCDPDGSNVFISRSDVDIPDLHSRFGPVAADLGVMLYDAGSMIEIGETRHAFLECSDWFEWQVVPKLWAQV